MQNFDRSGTLSLNGKGPVKALCLTITCLKFIGAQRSFLLYEFYGFGFLFILNLMSYSVCFATMLLILQES